MIPAATATTGQPLLCLEQTTSSVSQEECKRAIDHLDRMHNSYQKTHWEMVVIPILKFIYKHLGQPTEANYLPWKPEFADGGETLIASILDQSALWTIDPQDGAILFFFVYQEKDDHTDTMHLSTIRYHPASPAYIALYDDVAMVAQYYPLSLEDHGHSLSKKLQPLMTGINSGELVLVDQEAVEYAQLLRGSLLKLVSS